MFGQGLQYDVQYLTNRTSDTWNTFRVRCGDMWSHGKLVCCPYGVAYPQVGNGEGMEC